MEAKLRGHVFWLRVDHEAKREGLDISAHGESAYELQACVRVADAPKPVPPNVACDPHP